MDTSRMDIKEKQSAYHDWEARNYDAKFSISYDERCIEYARERFLKALPEGGTFSHVLEVGAGTGFFLVNLFLAGHVSGDDVHATDISEGMLQVCKRNAADHGLEVEVTQGDAEALPFPDDRFDLVIGHAFLHHLPDPQAALAEMHRVLAPGGILVVAGEPTRWGDAILRRIKRATYLGWTGLTSLPPLRSWRRSGHDHDGEDHGEVDGDEAAIAALEYEVDLHTFVPQDVARMAREIGFAEVRVRTEDLTASWLGWSVRTIEGSTAPGKLGERWAFWAYRNYVRLQRFDERVMWRIVPEALFYNLLLTARKRTG